MTATTHQSVATETSSDDIKQGIVERLGRARARTLALVEPLSDEARNRVHDPLMSPIAWDLGHIATFEDLWLVQKAFGRRPLREELGKVYDPFTAPRRERGQLPYLHSEQCLSHMEAVRTRTLACLERADLSGDASPLLRNGFVYEMVLRHELQHSETIMQTLQIMTAEAYEPARSIGTPAAAPDAPAASDGMTLVPGGEFEMGAPERGFAYDNERPRHVRAVEPFLIDVLPVTNADMIRFINDGGYERAEWWSPQGWRWRVSEEISMPRYWRCDGDGHVVRSFARWEPVEPRKPACHVSWYEADAYARYAGGRLPTEAEWEKAASWDAGAARKLTYPWGEEPPSPAIANLDQLTFGTAEAGAYPHGASPCGALGMLGDVWEWTASGFDDYEGFRAFPYREYSEVFFGGRFKVLRGGAWATQPAAVTSTFRNWDYPERRQIFSGFRCARDAEDA